MGEQIFVLVHPGREAAREFLHLLEESQRGFQGHPPDAEVGGHHPLAAYHFE